jgi:hypothetical protein
MRKSKALKVGGVQREEIRKIMCFVNRKAYFSSCYFFITHFPLHFKLISRAWGSILVTFLITQNETQMTKI